GGPTAPGPPAGPVYRGQGWPMSTTRNERLLTRQIARTLVCACLLAGCSHNLARPSVDLLPTKAARQVDAEVTCRPPSWSSLPAASVPGDRSTEADGPSAGLSVKEVPPAGDRGVRPVSFASDSILPLPEAIRYALQNNPRLRAVLAAIERAR